MELVKDVNEIEKIEDVIHRKKKGDFDNTIYSYDIEVTSLFKINDKWQCFDKSIEDYSGINKTSVPYISMFGINDKVYYFRDFRFFADILKYISNPKVRKYIFVHNLSYEFQFLLNIIDEDNWTVTKMTSRDLRKPIAFLIKELNIEFRCSYMLTNMSLDMASKIYTDVRKKMGQLDYNQARSPLTHLDDEELEYCEFDIICLYHIIKKYREKYGNKLCNIPLTSTGEVRKAIKKEIDYWYMVRRWENVPTREMYLIYMLCFAGGYTHGNYKHVGRICKNVSSRDIASSYPSCFFEKFPSEPFRWCPEDEYMSQPQYYSYIVQVEFTDCTSKFYNTYIQKSKMLNAKLTDIVYDNGRLLSCKGTFEMYLTEVDLELIKQCYDGEFKILRCWKSFKKYLDKRVLKFILYLFKNKTELKGQELTPELETLYRVCKALLNSLYGCSVSNPLKQSSDFVNGQWQRFSFSDDFIDSKLEEMKHSWSTLFDYTTGLYITSYARRNLFSCIIQMDKDVIYCDTDSIKYMNNHDDVFNKFNESVIERYNGVINRYPDDFNISDFSPVDHKGVSHTLGFFEVENDGDIEEFKTLGAKKYCYRVDGDLHLTLSGVNKKTGVKALGNDINNFSNDFCFNYDEAGKLIHYYNDEQEIITFTDIDGNKYTNDLKYGIVLQPTTYKIGSTMEYEALLQWYMIKESEVDFHEDDNYKYLSFMQ